MEFWIVLFLVVGIAVAVAGFTYCRLAGPAGQNRFTFGPLVEDLDTKYKPLLRLLNESEFNFLRRQEGFSPAIAYRFRRERVQAFRHYLTTLGQDFEKTNHAAKLLLMQSRQDRPDLALRLTQQAVSFRWSLLQLEARLCLFQFGITAIRPEQVMPLVGALKDSVRAVSLDPRWIS